MFTLRRSVWRAGSTVLAAMCLCLVAAAGEAAAQAPPGGGTGVTISGTVHHPSGRALPTVVVAFGDDGSVYWTRTADGTRSYLLAGLPAGAYSLVAYAEGGGIASTQGDCRAGAEVCRTTAPYRISYGEGATVDGVDFVRWRAAETLPPMPPIARVVPRPPDAGSDSPGLTGGAGGEYVFYGAAVVLTLAGLGGMLYGGLAGRRA